MDVINRNRLRKTVIAITQRRTGFGRIIFGFLLACLCGSVALWARIFASTDWVAGLIGLFLLPFLLALIVTRDLSATLGLVWINEIFFGVDGRWLQMGPIQARGALLLVFLIGSFVLSLGIRKRPSHSFRLEFMVLFYGMIIPCWLFLYSVSVRDTPMATAFGDTARFFVILAYFPLRKILKKEFHIVLGWVSGGVIILSAMMLFSAVGPQPLATKVYLAYSGAQRIATFSSGISRAATPLLVLTMIGVFLGLLYVVDKMQLKINRFIGLIIMSISLAPIVISFLRGPLISMLGVSIILLAAFACNRTSMHIGWRLGLLILGLFFLSTTIVSIFVPEGYERLKIGDKKLSEYIADPDREEQAQRMLKAFAESPFFGKGVGTPISGYQRGGDDDVLSYELHYHMLLYRVGAIVFALFVAPIIWFFIEPFRLCRKNNQFLFRREGKFAMAVLSALLVTFIAGATNPYLVTAFTMFLIALYLAIRQEWSL